MSFIDSTYFIREMTIAQTGQTNGNEAYLSLMINKYEPLFLSTSLGYAFSKLVVANATQPRFVSLIGGADYTKDGIVHQWIGLANSTLKISPIANYVYWYFVRSKWEQQSGTGTVRPKNENSKVIAPEYSMLKAWNEMVEMIGEMRCFLEANQSTYPEYQHSQAKCFKKQNHYGI